MNITRETIQFFWQHAWHYKKYVIGIFIVSPLAVLFHTFLSSLIVAGVLSRLVKGDFVQHDFFGSFGGVILLYIVVYLLGNVVFYRMLTFLMWKLEAAVSRDIAQQIFNHLMQLDADFHANRFAGSLVSQTTKLLSAFERVTDTIVYSVMPLLLVFIFTIVVLLPRAPLYIPVLLLLATGYIVVALISARRIRHFNTQEARASSQQTGFLADSLVNVLAVKSFASSKHEDRRFADTTEHTVTATLRLMRATIGRDTFFSLIGSSFSIAAVVMVIVSVMFFKADVATAFLMLTYSLAIAQRLWDFSAKALRDYNRAFGDAHDMIEILQHPQAVSDPSAPVSVVSGDGSVTFKHVDFAHVNTRETLFKNFTLTIHPGEKIGLVGHSGAGKTTFTKLLLRFANVDKGKILVDGQNIAQLTQDDLRHKIAYVPQEPLLFHRSIKENIAYGKPSATDKEISIAAGKAYATDFIKKLPSGYDTLVGERGIKLSGGQRQRIAIARAILKDAPILVLDEATSALDSQSEKVIQAALWELMQHRTTIVIAHRLSTIQKMDRIIVLEDGKIVEDDSHTNLLKKGGIYAKLWAHQSGEFIEE